MVRMKLDTSKEVDRTWWTCGKKEKTEQWEHIFIYIQKHEESLSPRSLYIFRMKDNKRST